MKSLTSNAATQSQSRYNEPVLLLEIDWSGGDTGRYSERDISIDGVDYAGTIRQIGPISCSLGSPAGSVERELGFPTDSTRPRAGLNLSGCGQQRPLENIRCGQFSDPRFRRRAVGTPVHA